MRRYETIFILRPSLNEGEINTVIENSSTIITDTIGTVLELDRWGMRKLAYPINKELQGFYVCCDYSSTPEAVAEMERKFRIDDSVLRYMTIKTADSITEEEIAEITSDLEAKQAETSEEADSSDEVSPKKSEKDATPETEEKSE